MDAILYLVLALLRIILISLASSAINQGTDYAVKRGSKWLLNWLIKRHQQT